MLTEHDLVISLLRVPNEICQCKCHGCVSAQDLDTEDFSAWKFRQEKIPLFIGKIASKSESVFTLSCMFSLHVIQFSFT